jgi:hypothetical protein
VTSLRLRKPKGQQRIYRFALLGVIGLAIAFAGLRALGLGQTEVLVATATIAPGDLLDERNTTGLLVDASGFTEVYASDLAEKSFATALVAKGELIPLRALAKTKLANLDSITLTVSSGLASSVREGSLVDLWSASGSGFGQTKPPRMLATKALVRAISRSESMAKRSIEVELAVNPSYLDAVIAAQAAGDFLAIVGRSAG